LGLMKIIVRKHAHKFDEIILYIRDYVEAMVLIVILPFNIVGTKKSAVLVSGEVMKRGRHGKRTDTGRI
jgi:hypothetical protein